MINVQMKACVRWKMRDSATSIFDVLSPTCGDLFNRLWPKQTATEIRRKKRTGIGSDGLELKHLTQSLASVKILSVTSPCCLFACL